MASKMNLKLQDQNSLSPGLMTSSISLNQDFDMLLLQTIRAGLTHAQIENGIRYEPFQLNGEKKLKYGFTFRIPNLQEGRSEKKCFYFENTEEGISARLDFSGNILENKNNLIPARILVDLEYYLSKASVQCQLERLWNNTHILT